MGNEFCDVWVINGICLSIINGPIAISKHRLEFWPKLHLGYYPTRIRNLSPHHSISISWTPAWTSSSIAIVTTFGILVCRNNSRIIEKWIDRHRWFSLERDQQQFTQSSWTYDSRGETRFGELSTIGFWFMALSQKHASKTKLFKGNRNSNR